MGDYNKPITARIQHSTSRGMKIQEPLLDIGSVANANAALIQGEKAAAGRTPDAAGAFKAGMDSQKSESSDTGTQETTPGPTETGDTETPESPAPASKYGAMLAANIEKGMSPKEAGKQAAVDIKKEPKSMVKKSYMPTSMAKNYKNFKSYKIGKGGKR